MYRTATDREIASDPSTKRNGESVCRKSVLKLILAKYCNLNIAADLVTPDDDGDLFELWSTVGMAKRSFRGGETLKLDGSSRLCP